jgi:hypothetical protein
VNQPPVLLLIRIEEVHQELRSDGSGAEGIDADTFAGVDGGEFTGHGEDGTLRGGVYERKQKVRNEGKKERRGAKEGRTNRRFEE